MRRLFALVVALLAAYGLAFGTFYVGFGGSHEVIPGYTCSPTWKFGYECTAPDGHMYGERR